MGAGTLMQKERARTAERQLGDLISIGPAMLRDFELLEFTAWRNSRGRIRSGCTRNSGAWRASIRTSACWTLLRGGGAGEESSAACREM